MKYSEINMKSKKIKISKINRKTKAEMFETLKENDYIIFEIPLKRSGSGRSVYASYIKITNLRTNEYTYKSFNELSNILDAFELQEVGD